MDEDLAFLILGALAAIFVLDLVAKVLRRPKIRFDYRAPQWRRITKWSIKENAKRFGRRTCERCLGHARNWRRKRRRRQFHTDHIKPVSLYPKRSLCRHNAQQMCHRCNTGKGNRSSVNWWQINRLPWPIRWPTRWTILTWQRWILRWRF